MGSLEGRTLDHFRVERLIGSGGMGAVYEAVDEHLERPVALKVLLREGDTALNQKRFLREARLAAKLTHPNIATVFEVGEFESHLYIVMELLEGQSLRKLLTTQRLETEQIHTIARDIARALARAHAAGVTHRDIKPENVFVTTPSPNVVHAKVLDFGLARQQQKAAPQVAPSRKEEETQTTAPGDVLGTPGYWSPEQARSGEVDVRTDIFSFGLVLYEMIAGRRAYKANTTVALVLAVTRHEPEPLRKYAPSVAPELEAIVTRCIAKDPAQRYADGGELLEAIEAISRVSARASLADSSDTTADAGGPPVAARWSNVPQAPESGPGLSAPTPPGTTIDAEPVPLDRPIDRVRLFAAIGAGCAVAGVLLIVATVIWGGKSGPSASATAPVASPEAPQSPPPSPPSRSAPQVSLAPAAPAAPAPVASVLEPVATAEATVEPPPAPPAPEPAPSVTMIPTPLAAPAVTMIPTPLATAVPVATSAGTSAAVPAGSARPRRDRKADCAQPFTVDAKGVKIPKLHCL